MRIIKLESTDRQNMLLRACNEAKIESTQVLRKNERKKERERGSASKKARGSP